MADSEAEPTAWELMRTLRTIAEDVRYVRENSATREALRDLRTEMREAVNAQGAELGEERRSREVADEKAKTERLAMIAAEAAIRDEAIKAERATREKEDARIERQLDKMSGWVKWGGSSGLTVLLAVVGWILSRGGG